MSGLFPSTLTVQTADGKDVTITLNADGTFTGDGKAFLATLETAPMGYDYHGPIFWLVARAIKRDLEGIEGGDF